MSTDNFGIQACGPRLPGERHLIADYLEHLGAVKTRRMLLHVAANAEGLLERIEAPIRSGDPAFRRIAHDISGTLGTLGLATYAAMARSIEASPPDMEAGELDRLLQPLLVVRGRIAGSVMATLDELIIETGQGNTP